MTHDMLVLVRKALHIVRVLDATGAGDDPDPRRQRLERIEAYLIERYKRGATLTPYWTSPDGRHVIHCGDNVAVMSGFPDASIDLVVTSPPYDNLRTYSAGKSMADLWDFEGVAQQLWRLIKPGGVVVWVVADATIDGSETGTSFRQALRFMEIGFRLHDTMTWNKGGFSAVGSCQVRYGPSTEFMFVFSRGDVATFNPIKDRPNIHAGVSRNPRTFRESNGEFRGRLSGMKAIGEYGIRFNVWTIPEEKSNTTRTGHPAQFPESLARDHILSWSNEGDIVLDPFNGSGTTTKMAMAMGRRFIGIEISEAYVKIAVKRMERELSQPMLPFEPEPEKAVQGTMFTDAENDRIKKLVKEV
jgi:site-specific DNA-methyltransferase (adenine-specific)